MSEAISNESFAAEVEEVSQGSARGNTLKRLLRSPLAVICIAYLTALVVVAVTVPLWVPHPIDLQDVVNRLAPPSAEHWLGTDELGRDLFSRMLYGARVAVLAPVIAVGVAILLGVTSGLAAGYFGGWADRLVMRAADVLQSVPLLLIAFAVVGAFGSSLTIAMISVGVVLSASYARLARAVTLSIREKPYIDAAKVIGLSPLRILVQQVTPMAISPLLVHTAVLVGAALLIEASLSFVGVGTELGTPSWGSMLSSAPQYQDRQIWVTLAPGLMITLTVLACNLLGDTLRDALFGRAIRKRRSLVDRYLRPERSLAGRTVLAPTISEPASLDASQVSRPRVSSVVEEPLSARSILQVRGLSVAFPHGADSHNVIQDVSFNLPAGGTFGLVGESGSGKSMALSAIMGMIPSPGWVASGEILYEGKDLLALPAKAMRSLRGSEIAVISQDPMAALSPVHNIGKQISESMIVHLGYTKRQAMDESARMLDLVGVPDARARLADYPFQFSGGMAQRVMIAAALACKPRILLADEPTTALDVRIQAQVLDLVDSLRRELDMSLIMVSHDLGVIAETCEQMAVMYAGEIVEMGETHELLKRPRHPYTAALLKAMPRNETRGDRLATIPGIVPAPGEVSGGCRFAARCDFATDSCRSHAQVFSAGVRCERVDELRLEVKR